MKKTLRIILVLFTVFSVLPFPVQADDTDISSMVSSVPGFKPILVSPTAIISELLPYALTLAGLILFGMLIIGGFEIMTAATDTKKADAGKARITTAVIGFVIIFAAYWITQILEIMTGVSIL
jgi:Type IV secretion system pilin